MGPQGQNSECSRYILISDSYSYHIGMVYLQGHLGVIPRNPQTVVGLRIPRGAP